MYSSTPGLVAQSTGKLMHEDFRQQPSLLTVTVITPMYTCRRIYHLILLWMPNWHMKEKPTLLVLWYQDTMPIMVGLPSMLGNNLAKPLIRVLATAVLALITKIALLNAEYEISPMHLGRHFYPMTRRG
jgi:hypothetical protein